MVPRVIVLALGQYLCFDTLLYFTDADKRNFWNCWRKTCERATSNWRPITHFCVLNSLKICALCSHLTMPKAGRVVLQVRVYVYRWATADARGGGGWSGNRVGEIGVLISSTG